MPDPIERLRRFAADESGQTLTEWAIVAAFLVIGLAALFGTFPDVLGGYYSRLVSYLLLPVF